MKINGTYKYHAHACEKEYNRPPLVAQLFEALRYKPEDHGFHSRWCHWNFLLS
jgi:hypothetical protein